MTSGGNNFNYFSENKLTKLENFVQILYTYANILSGGLGGGLGPLALLATPLISYSPSTPL